MLRHMESGEISEHEIRFWKALHLREWQTSRELAEAAGVAPRTARAFALKFVRLGIAEQAEVFPGHRYRVSPFAEKRNRGYVDRLHVAAQVFVVE